MVINDNKLIQGIMLTEEEYQNEKYKYDNDYWLEKRDGNHIFIENHIPYCILHLDMAYTYKKIVNRTNVLFLMISEVAGLTKIYINDLKKLNKKGIHYFEIKDNEFKEKEFNRILEFLKIYYGYEIHILTDNVDIKLVNLILEKYQNSDIVNNKVYFQLIQGIKLSEKQSFKLIKYTSIFFIFLVIYFVLNMFVSNNNNENISNLTNNITDMNKKNEVVDLSIKTLKEKDEYLNIEKYKAMKLKNVYIEENL